MPPCPAGLPTPAPCPAAPGPTCSRLRSVTSSLLRLRRRCCRCTASLEEDASETQNSDTFNAGLLFISLVYIGKESVDELVYGGRNHIVTACALDSVI